MTNPYRAMCAELIDALDSGIPAGRIRMSPLADRARALLAESVTEEPTDQEIEEWADACSEAPLEEMDPEVHGWRRCFTAKEFSETIRAAIARWGRPTPQPVWADIHYAWELHDAEGEWQAGGSANRLEDVQRHCVSTIEEAQQ